MIVPPVADQVTASAAVLPSLILPCAVNCCLAPVASRAVAVAGVSTTEDNVGAVVGAVIVALAVSALVSPCRTAITRNVPAVLPAVYSPVPEMVPPVSDQVTATLVALPSLIRPKAVNCRVAPAANEALDGVISTRVRVGAGAAIVTLAVSALVSPCRTAITRNVPTVVPDV